MYREICDNCGKKNSLCKCYQSEIYKIIRYIAIFLFIFMVCLFIFISIKAL
jgi:hypothetical protein